MKQKMLAVFITVTAALVGSLTLTMTAFAEEYPVIHTEDVITEISQIPDSGRDENGVRYICDRFGNLTDVPFDAVYENQRYEMCFYHNGIGYTGIAIVDGEEWKFENGTALNGWHDIDGDGSEDCIYYNGKPLYGPYTYFKDAFVLPGHLESCTDKYGNVYEAYYLCYADEEDASPTGWYGPENYRRFYYQGDLFSGYAGIYKDENGATMIDNTLYGQVKDTPDCGKYFDKGLWFTGFIGSEKYLSLYIAGDRYCGEYRMPDEMTWYSTVKDSVKQNWNFETGQTYLFTRESDSGLHTGFYEIDGITYWYEGGIRQGTEGRGKEIYDPDTDAWYWLDAIDNGKVATGKDVYQESYAGAYADRPDGTGKWVRYNENGHMVKGWAETEAGTYYFDLETGAMAKGTATIAGKEYTFDKNTGLLTGGTLYDCVWVSVDGKEYWYENGVRQGYEPENPDYRGKEIYDPGTDAWYWLDNVRQGAKAVSKDVYQESWAGSFGDNGEYGKWVRYDEKGHMVKGWDTVYEYDAAGGRRDFYFDLETGAMAKGMVSVIEMFYDSLYETIVLFDEEDGHLIEYISNRVPYTGDREAGSAIRLE